MYSPGAITPVSRRFWGCPVIVADGSSCSSSMVKCGYRALELEGCALSVREIKTCVPWLGANGMAACPGLKWVPVRDNERRRFP